MIKKLIIGISLILLIATGCSITKKALTTEEFANIVKNQGMIVADVNEQFKDYGYIKEATVAANTEGWQIEFYVLDTKNDAKTMYNKNSIEFNKESTNSSSKIEVGNYKKEVLESSDYYMVLARVDNTLLYVKVPTKYKEKAKEIVNALEY